MKAITQHRYGPPDVLEISDVPRPEPLPTEVLVRVHAAWVNPIDWKTRGGHGLPGIGEPPFILGWDVSGVVEEVGFGVHTLRVGDEVYGMPWFPPTGRRLRRGPQDLPARTRGRRARRRRTGTQQRKARTERRSLTKETR